MKVKTNKNDSTAKRVSNSISLAPLVDVGVLPDPEDVAVAKGACSVRLAGIDAVFVI